MSQSRETNHQPPKAQQPHNDKTNTTQQSIATGNQLYSNNPNGQGHKNKQSTKNIFNPIVWFTFFLVIVGVIQAVTMCRTVSDSRATQRAFVYVTKFNYNLFGDTLHINPVWENSGTTPTRKMINSVSNIVIDNNKSIDNYSFQDLDETGKPLKDKSGCIPLYIGPKGALWGGTVKIPLKTIKMASNGQCRIFVYGWAEYNDIFAGTDRHRTEFYRELVIPMFNKIPDIKIMDVLVKQHNCSDDECK